MNKEDIIRIIGIAMLFDEKQRFDAWHGDEVKEWVEMVAKAIWSAQQKQTDCEHEWVDMKNEVIQSGEYCPKCGAVRPQNKDIPLYTKT